MNGHPIVPTVQGIGKVMDTPPAGPGLSRLEIVNNELLIW